MQKFSRYSDLTIVPEWVQLYISRFESRLRHIVAGKIPAGPLTKEEISAKIGKKVAKKVIWFLIIAT